VSAPDEPALVEDPVDDAVRSLDVDEKRFQVDDEH
jgi:hypothetical protein